MAVPDEIRKIDSEARLREAVEASRERPVWVFKHSLTCSISDAGWQEFLRFVAAESQEPDTLYGVIEIQNARAVSNAFAEQCHVRHESPQAILLRDGRAIWHKSHWQITQDNMIYAQLTTADGYEATDLEECW